MEKTDMNSLSSVPITPALTPRRRVELSLNHQAPDRIPTDFFATPEVWDNLASAFGIEKTGTDDGNYFEESREKVLRRLAIDCRVISYDMFINPPAAMLTPGAVVDWWGSLNRSTPNRMWRQKLPDDTAKDVWGRCSGPVQNAFGAYEEIIYNPLYNISSLEDLKRFPWPTPDWWDFTGLPGLIEQYDRLDQYHLRFRVGSVFEVAWQLRGMEAFLIDLVTQPQFSEYIMDRLTEVYVANLRSVLELASERIDMIYIYDDVATQNSLLLSKKAWTQSIRPRHAKIFELARQYGKQIMYHCDGAISFLLPELLDMGVTAITPVQVDAKGMQPELLKEKFGNRLSFHGGIDIIGTLRKGKPDEVAAEVQDRVRVLGQGGGYILASSHHIQPDTPVENIHAMYDLNLRYEKERN
jgi:uroporphyrinogen decarboxylase